MRETAYFSASPTRLMPPGLLVDRPDVLDPDRQSRRVVVAQVLADARQRVAAFDAEGPQVLGIADARELQQLGRVVGAAGEDDFAPRAHLRVAPRPAAAVSDADGALAVQHEAGRQRAGSDLEVLALQGRTQEGIGRADPAAVQHVALDVAHALLDRAVIVGIARDAVLDAPFDERLGQRVAPIEVGDRQRALGAAVERVAALALLHPAEIGQHVGIAPAAIAALGPMVEVSRLAAVPDHAVDRRGPAERLAARRINPAAGRAL